MTLTSCTKDLEKNETNNQVNTSVFNYETTLSGEFEFVAPSQLANATFEIYTSDPETGGHLLGAGKFDNQGQFNTSMILPTSLNKVYFKSTYVGLPGGFDIEVNNGVVYHDFDLSNSAVRSNGKRRGSTPQASTVNNVVYNYMGGFNYWGVPNYLEVPGDVISQGLIDACNASLPESNPVPTANPHYLATGNSTDLVITDSCDVWITFVHEGAGYRNSLGYYVYPTNNPPSTASDIDSIHFIFPNISFAGSGGGLYSGDKVHLGSFAAGHSIGWVIVQNAWNGSGVNTSKYHFYSNPDFNPESSASKRQHNVQLYDRDRDLVLIGFEDLKRDAGSDDDFNDAVFYVTANPITAIQTGTLPPVTNGGNDSDGDGVPDTQDEYPSDPDKAFNNYTPYQNGYSSVAFEDLWPSKGDYDFNDLVIKANYNCISNGVNELAEIQMELIVDHIGASFHNGFGIELPVSPSVIQTVTGYNITDNLVTLSSKGLETGQTNAVVIVFDDAFDNNADTLNITVSFSTPANKSAFSQAGMNPFIFVDGERGREVHLPNKAPTDKMNMNYFGTAADNSNPGAGIYYKTVNNEPWGINISHSYEPPVERVNIGDAYLKFNTWVSSNGTQFTDWYEDNAGYRNNANIQ